MGVIILPLRVFSYCSTVLFCMLIMNYHSTELFCEELRIENPYAFASCIFLNLLAYYQGS